MKKTIIGYGAVCALVVLAVSCASKPQEAPPPEAPPQVTTYQLPLDGFRSGTGAELDGDTIVFTGGGLDYLLPEGLDLSIYSQLALVYETSDWEDNADVQAKTGSNRMQLSIGTWNGVEGDSEEAVRTAYYYPILAEGAGEAVLFGSFIRDDDEPAERAYAVLQEEGVKGFTILANTFENDGIANYRVKIVSLELRP